MKRHMFTVPAFLAAISTAHAQSGDALQTTLCDAAENNRVIEMVYEGDESKGCEPRLVDVHEVAIGNNGQYYLHGWQSRGCTKGRDFAALRIFKFEKIQSVQIIDGEFEAKSQAHKDEGWDGCLGKNCFIKEMICE